MWYTEMIELFKRLYTRFRRDYENFLKSFGNKYFICYVSLSFKVPASRVPYYAYSGPAFQRSTPTGYLPASLDSYYLKEVPVFFYSGKDTFLKRIDAALTNAGTNSLIFRNAGLTEKYLLDGMQFYIKPYLNNAYNGLIVNYDPAIMDVALTVVRAEVFAKNMLGNLYVQDQLDLTLKSHEIAYNRCAELLKNPKLSAAQQAAIKNALDSVQRSIMEIKSNPDYTVKVCADCANNSSVNGIGIVPLIIAAIVVIGALAWHAVDKYAANVTLARDTAERLKVRQINADRITAALGKMQNALSDPNLTDAQKAIMQAAAEAEIKAGQDDTGKITDQQQNQSTKSNMGFFDHIENIILLAGGVLLINNLTKK